MPRYTRHQETGLLLHNHFGFVLDMGGGAFWVLECWSVPRAKHYLGQRVTVEGTRIGFNILDVDRMWRAGEPRPLMWTERLTAVVSGAFARVP